MSAERMTPKRVSTRFIVLVVIILLHGALFYFLATQRSRTSSVTDERQAFTPIVKPGASSGGLPEKKKAAEDAPGRRWRFEIFDLWPADAAGKASMESSSIEKARALFVTDAGKIVASGDALSAGKDGIAIRSGALPEYPSAWARGGEEGSVFLEASLDAQGKPIEVRVLRSSASDRLENAAKQAVSSWMFSMLGKTAEAASTPVELELRFNAYRYGLTRLAEPRPDGEVRVPTEPVSSDEAFRDMVRELSSSKPTFATSENTQPDFQKLRGTVVTWGKPKSIRLLNPRESEWAEFVAHRDFRYTSEGGTIAVRWDLYEVQHENATASWKVAVDRWGRIWAAKTDTR